MTGNKLILIGMHLLKEACELNFRTNAFCNECPLMAQCGILFVGNDCIPVGFQFDED